MKPINEVKLNFPSNSCNEGFARMAVSSFLVQLDPTVEELNDIKTVVSEAVTNCTVHAYPDSIGLVYITVSIFEDRRVRIKVKDSGKGIEDIAKAMEPTFSTAGAERAGIGFSVMESFTDSLKVRSAVGKGTVVTMVKQLSKRVRS